jgi:hypothetical protein
MQEMRLQLFRNPARDYKNEPKMDTQLNRKGEKNGLRSEKPV